MTVRDFRANFSKLSEPVEVVCARAPVRVLGTYWPADASTDRTPVRYAQRQPKTTKPNGRP